MDEPHRIDIPESVDAYKITLFWGLTILHVVLVFVATLCIGFGIFNVVSKSLLTALFMFAMAALVLLGIVEIRGRNFYRHILFMFAYYASKPRVLIYHHHEASAGAANKQLVFAPANNKNMLLLISGAVVTGILLLLLTAYYILHVIH